MAAQTKFQDFVEQLCKGVHQLHAAGHTLRVALATSAPVNTNTVLADITQVANGNGYTTGGSDIQNEVSRTGGTATITAVDVVFTASGAGFTSRYQVFYNDTPTSPADPLITFTDYGSSLVLAAGENLTIDFGASFGTLS